jgi:hypothetical protein
MHYGERGRDARAAVAVAWPPGNSKVEIQASVLFETQALRQV